ncbi:MAG TPA: Hsp20/alpha crystallin family protein [Armatimonadota bacterium]
MNIVRWDPFRDLEALQENVNRLFQEQIGPKREGALTRAWSPVVDVVEDQDKIVVKAELPGMKREDIDIELSGETLTIRGERKFEDQENKDNYVRVERTYGKFMRSFTIGVPIKAGEVKANYKDGILELTIPKAEEIRPKKVEVAVD